MAKNNDNIVLPNTVTPKVWHTRDLYQEYAAFILRNDLQCWGKYNVPAKRKNYWIYKTVKMPSGATKVVEVMNYRRWKQVVTTYFEAAKRRIIFEGAILSLGHLGRIWPKRIERDFTKPRTNWIATMRQPKVLREGKLVPERIIYYTEEDYIRIGWRKNNHYTNEAVYEFKPTNNDGVYGALGFSQEFSRANMSDPMLKFKYEYFPLKDRSPREEVEEEEEQTLEV